MEPLFRSPFPCKILIILVEKNTQFYWRTYFFLGRVPVNLLACNVQLDVQPHDLLLHEPKVGYSFSWIRQWMIQYELYGILFHTHNTIWHFIPMLVVYIIEYASDWDILVFMLVVYEHTCNWDNLLVGYDWIRLGLGHFILHVGCVW